MDKFQELLFRVRAKNKLPVFEATVLALDPGETTGWALFHGGGLVGWGQETCEGTAGYKQVSNLIATCAPKTVICENYRVYGSKRDQHVGSDLYTVRLIGAIEHECMQRNIPCYFQMAAIGKGFSTDTKLKMWGYWKQGQRHSRDAIRHGCHWLLFGKEKL